MAHGTSGGQIRLRREDRQQQLLDVALSMFIERGYQGTSIEDLARAAGVTRPIIYAHFGSKDGIYLACLRRARAELNAKFEAIAGRANTSLDRLRLGVEAYFSFVESHRSEWGILFGGGAAVAGPAAAEATRLRFETVSRITDLLAGVIPSQERGALDAYSHAVSGAGEQLAKWWLENPHIPRQRVVAYLVDFAWAGIKDLSAV